MANRTRIYHGRTIAQADFARPAAEPVDRADVNVSWHTIDEFAPQPPSDTAAVVLLADAAAARRLASTVVPDDAVVVVTDAESAALLDARADMSMAGMNERARISALDTAIRFARARADAALAARRLAQTEYDFAHVSRIGSALMHERNRRAFVNLVLESGKQLTDSDTAGLLAVQRKADGQEVLRPIRYAFDSVPGLDVPNVRFAIDETTIAGHVGLTKKPVVVADLHALPPGTTFTGSLEFERQYSFYSKSMMAMPLLGHNERLLGVLVFINRKRDRTAFTRSKEEADAVVLPYTDREVRLAQVLASQTAVAVENVQLQRRIERMLDGMVKAAVSAVDRRDPATAGHSLRVARLAVDLAAATARYGRGRYAGRRFSQTELRELRYAALLHDLGKIAVREDVLMKANKLPPLLWERISSRFDFIRRTLQLNHEKARAGLCLSKQLDPDAEQELDARLEARLRDLDRLQASIVAANRPSISAREGAGPELSGTGGNLYRAIDGSHIPYLTADELHYLRLPRGSLDEAERAEIESHVAYTYQFLSQIPWTDDLAHVPEYAYGHHEKLDGSGYPRHLRGDEIPVQTRIITLADIFDALTEADRPYKPAMTPARAIEVLRAEAKAGLLDADLVEILAESRVYEHVLGSTRAETTAKTRARPLPLPEPKRVRGKRRPSKRP